jgi:hypothetical protein
MLSSAVGSAGDKLDFGTVLKLVSSSAVGGTVSSIGGGNFANGAITGAYTFLLNHKLHRANNKQLPELSNDKDKTLINNSDKAVHIQLENEVQDANGNWHKVYETVEAGGSTTSKIDAIKIEGSGETFKVPNGHSNIIVQGGSGSEYSYNVVLEGFSSSTSIQAFFKNLAAHSFFYNNSLNIGDQGGYFDNLIRHEL